MRSRRFRRFLRHYLEMVAAMLIGMMALYPLWTLATAGVSPESVPRSVEVESLVMATTMAVPMAAWMRFRRHDWTPTLEMSAAMYAGFVATFPFHWAGAVGEHAVMMIGHVAMFVLMLTAMLWRHQEYTDHSTGRYPGGQSHGTARAQEPGATIGTP